MKLNLRRTFLIGLAYLSISAFWQLYEATMPLMLKNTFGLGDAVSGVVMAADNILALFLLPFFGALSDRCRARMGRRMPFILVGACASAVCAYLLPLADQPGRQTAFFACLGMLLLFMSVYRAPAVALMPDVTPKPLRSKGNAIINLMGALGGVIALGSLALAVPKAAEGAREDYALVYAIVAVVMLAAVLLLTLCFREREAVREAGESPEDAPTGARVPPEARRSLLLILASVALWYMGYNAVMSAFTKYAASVWDMGVDGASGCLMVATVGAIVAFWPAGLLASRVGRKRVICVSAVLLAACFALAACFSSFTPAMYALFALVGFAWAAINVNSYPMVVEIGSGADVGRYTGFYYTCSMAAQIAAPIGSGALLEWVGYWTLFPFAALMVLLSCVTMSLTKHGDSGGGHG